MNIKYSYVPVQNIQRIIFLSEISDKRDLLADIRQFSQEIASLLDSSILSDVYHEFPSDINGIKNYTYVGILSTSHIVVSTYISKNECYIDIDLVWCSGVKISSEKFLEVFEKYFGKPVKYVYKKLDAYGNEIE